MRNLRTVFATGAALLAGLSLGASAARADDMVTVTVVHPTHTVKVRECPKGCVLTVLFEVVNEDDANIATTFTEHADPFSGDVENDVLVPSGFDGPPHLCGFSLAPLTPCDVIAEFTDFDTDPLDLDEPDMDPPDSGDWLASLTVNWTYAKGVPCPSFAKTCSGSSDSPGLEVDVMDDPLTAPEPAAWGLLLTGLGLVGARLRQRRAVAAPAA